MLRSLWLLLLIVNGFIPGVRTAAQEPTPTSAPPPMAIYSPTPGQALQGIVSIEGNIAVDGFQSAELSFTYNSDPRDTWFLIREFTEPAPDETLAEWDTTTLTDGEYTLRLIVTLAEKSQPSITVVQVRVRNYTPIETDTPAPTATSVPGNTPAPSAIPTLTDTPVPLTATPVNAAEPTNPAELTSQEISSSLGKGALAVLAAFVVLGLYQAIRTAIRRGGRG